eukprot:CAMPEP_0176266766 /NCGR_PEP_ID=MMETSP0121_2-20121125/42814_1 /TAXON_ID=160619 /ORGANISM="Kryptoperidinium foliaceum, Strain CCMP 1326" /LENGTH=186 /DNA_ID=CAMNT_0017606811 /DNA_START=14 /DNA_END=571 /DNA_ORIENTATION=-
MAASSHVSRCKAPLRHSLPPSARPLHLPMWRRELHADAVGEEAWLVAVRHARVHHGAVPVAPHVRAQALVPGAPRHAAHLAAPEAPGRVAVEGGPEARDVGGVHQVHEGVAEIAAPREVDGQVDEVVGHPEALVAQHLQEHLAGVVVGQVAHHQRRAGVRRPGPLGHRLCARVRPAGLVIRAGLGE